MDIMTLNYNEEHYSGDKIEISYDFKYVLYLSKTENYLLERTGFG